MVEVRFRDPETGVDFREIKAESVNVRRGKSGGYVITVADSRTWDALLRFARMFTEERAEYVLGCRAKRRREYPGASMEVEDAAILRWETDREQLREIAQVTASAPSRPKA